MTIKEQLESQHWQQIGIDGPADRPPTSGFMFMSPDHWSIHIAGVPLIDWLLASKVGDEFCSTDKRYRRIK